tara:strand:- start:312 stop:491 length:180 start_codon:yes stop_codon:yes gene_type:complete
LGQLFECLNPDAYKKRQPIFKSIEGDFGDVEMKLTANRRVCFVELVNGTTLEANQDAIQ